MESITLPASLDSLAQISAFITSAAEHSGLDERATWQLQLAVDEATTNVIQHAYDAADPGTMTLTWDVQGTHFIVTLHDRGRSFNPDEVPAPDIESPLEERQAGGLGIYLMTRLMDEVRFDFDPHAGNLLTMVKYLGPDARRDVVVMPLRGRVDAITSPKISAQAREQISGGARFLLVDLAEVSFLSSSGLRALLLIRKELMTHGGELRLCGLQPQVHEVFALTGFTQVFAIHANEEEARAAFGQGRA
ncbi:MAG: anti-sigma factor antagonist [Chloroflexales bacterium]|nr:anti-sigma factor antagonist [Chloroflexales bacterium]